MERPTVASARLGPGRRQYRLERDRRDRERHRCGDDERHARARVRLRSGVRAVGRGGRRGCARAGPRSSRTNPTSRAPDDHWHPSGAESVEPSARTLGDVGRFIGSGPGARPEPAADRDDAGGDDGQIAVDQRVARCVSQVLERCPFADRVGVVQTDCSRTREIPQGSAATTATTAATIGTARMSVRRRRDTTRIPTATSAGSTSRLFTENAAPARMPMTIARRVDGDRRYAECERDRDRPPARSRDHRPRGVQWSRARSRSRRTRPAARSARRRVVELATGEVDRRSRSRSPRRRRWIGASRRFGASRDRRTTPTGGRAAPGSRTPRGTVHRPPRIAMTDAPNTPSSNTRLRPPGMPGSGSPGPRPRRSSRSSAVDRRSDDWAAGVGPRGSAGARASSSVGTRLPLSGLLSGVLSGWGSLERVGRMVPSDSRRSVARARTQFRYGKPRRYRSWRSTSS